jgi:hypothetical protein
MTYKVGKRKVSEISDNNYFRSGNSVTCRRLRQYGNYTSMYRI